MNANRRKAIALLSDTEIEAAIDKDETMLAKLTRSWQRVDRRNLTERIQAHVDEQQVRMLEKASPDFTRPHWMTP